MRYLKRYVTVLSLGVLIVVASFVFAGMLERIEQHERAAQEDPFRGPAYNIPDAK